MWLSAKTVIEEVAQPWGKDQRTNEMYGKAGQLAALKGNRYLGYGKPYMVNHVANHTVSDMANHRAILRG